MTVPAIGPIGGITPPAPITPVTGPAAAASTAGASGVNFATALGNGLAELQQVQSNADGLAVQAATGDLADVHDYMIASTEASLATELTTAVRDKALAAFNSVMEMQA